MTGNPPRKLYDEIYYKTSCEGFELPHGQLSQRLKAYFGWVDKAIDAPGQTVMDFGFGRGELAIQLAKHPNVDRVIAVDYSATAGKFLMDLIGTNDDIADKIMAVVSDGHRFMSILDTKIHHIVAFDVIEHLDPHNIIAFFKQAARLVPKGGRVFVVTPVTNAPPNERHIWLARRPEDLWQFAPGFSGAHLGVASGEDHRFEFVRL